MNLIEKIYGGRIPLAFLMLMGLLMFLPTSVQADQSVTFGWDASTDPTVVGYNIYYGGASHVYTNKVSFGNVTSATISGLTEGVTYYFAATTYDFQNQESALTDEITYTVPAATNQSPTITGLLSTNTTLVGQYLSFSVTATGSGPFTYSLGLGAASGARINPTNGVFRWNAGITQASTTNVISVIVTDSGNPPQTTTQVFTIAVPDYVGIFLGSTVMATNSSGSISVGINASTAISNLQFNLDYPASYLANPVFLVTNPLVTIASITPIQPGQALITLAAGAGQFLTGSQAIGQVTFNSSAALKSAFVYLQTDNPLAEKSDGTSITNIGSNQGRVVIVGQDSLVEAQLNSGARSLIVYGPVGAGYQVESCNTLGAWFGTGLNFTMTNLVQVLQLTPDTNAETFYRTLQTQ